MLGKVNSALKGLLQVAYRTATSSKLLHYSSQLNMANKSAVVLLAEGAEEMEFVIAADVLRRAEFDVTVAGVAGAEPVKCSRGVIIVPDKSLKDVMTGGPYDVIILPGGLGGSNNLASSCDVGEFLKDQEKNDRYIAAICAAPTALKAHGIGLGKKVTSYPAMKDQMEEGNKYSYLEDKVVVDGKLITSRGPGTAFDFALQIVATINGKNAAVKVAEPMLVSPPENC